MEDVITLSSEKFVVDGIEITEKLRFFKGNILLTTNERNLLFTRVLCKTLDILFTKKKKTKKPSNKQKRFFNIFKVMPLLVKSKWDIRRVDISFVGIVQWILPSRVI